MTTARKFLLVLFSSATPFAIGCVKQNVHDAALKDLETKGAALDREHGARTRAERLADDRGSRIKELEQTLATATQERNAIAAERTELAAKLARAEESHAAMQARADAAELGLAELVKRRAGIKAEIRRMTDALAQLGSRQIAAEKRVKQYREMLARFRPLIDAGTLDVRVVDGRMVLTLPMDILFASGSTKLSNEGKDALTTVGKTLATLSERKFQVEGHTDDVPIHNERFASNWELASGRALTVLHSLLDAGIVTSQLSAASYGEFQPRADNTSDRGRALNRRIEIVVVPDLTGLPGSEEISRLAGE